MSRLKNIDPCILEVVLKKKWGISAENREIFRRLIMNMAAVANPERGMASVRRAATFEVDYLKGILGKIFLREGIKSF